MNNLLVVVLVVVNLYVIATPFLPQLLFKLEQGKGTQQQLEQSLQTPPSQPPSSPGETPATPPATNQPNHLVAPVMLLDQQVFEGQNAAKGLDQGVWRWPGSSTPDKGGNTVLAGHRYTYTNPKGVFYFLDKLSIGDTVGLVWNNTTYVYRVSDVQTVPPSQTSILAHTEEPTLTLYTCTPLWLPKSRLVVTARLETINGIQQ